MTWSICADCSAAYAVGQPACPQCKSTDYFEEGTVGNKNTKARGATLESNPPVDGDTPVSEREVTSTPSSADGGSIVDPERDPAVNSQSNDEKPEEKKATEEPEKPAAPATSSTPGRTGVAVTATGTVTKGKEKK